MRKRIAVLIGCALTVGLIAGGLALYTHERVLEQVEWADQPARMIFDHHTHSTYSDGALNLQQLLSAAKLGGCDAIAVTDHSDVRKSVSEEKFTEIDRLRTQYPSMLIIAGLELEMPSYDGREHVNILPSPLVERALLNATMATLYEGAKPNQDKESLDRAVLEVMDAWNGTDGNVFAIYNHPSRRDKDLRENVDDYRRWHAASNALIGLAGAPGHQKSDNLGSYDSTFPPQHRWDPAIATIGGAWDQLLDAGYPVWGAIASSDYHNDNLDYIPCSFSRIHVAAPTLDYKGLMLGLTAGTFWSDHGGLLEVLQLRLDVSSVSEPLYPGAQAELNADDLLGTVTLRLRRRPEHVAQHVRFDLISSCSSGRATLIDSGYLSPEKDSVQRLLAIDQSAGRDRCHLRARVIKETIEGEELAAYTNPIRLLLP